MRIHWALAAILPNALLLACAAPPPSTIDVVEVATAGGDALSHVDVGAGDCGGLASLPLSFEVRPLDDRLRFRAPAEPRMVEYEYPSEFLYPPDPDEAQVVWIESGSAALAVVVSETFHTASDVVSEVGAIASDEWTLTAVESGAFGIRTPASANARAVVVAAAWIAGPDHFVRRVAFVAPRRSMNGCAEVAAAIAATMEAGERTIPEGAGLVRTVPLEAGLVIDLPPDMRVRHELDCEGSYLFVVPITPLGVDEWGSIEVVSPAHLTALGESTERVTPMLGTEVTWHDRVRDGRFRSDARVGAGDEAVVLRIDADDEAHFQRLAELAATIHVDG